MENKKPSILILMHYMELGGAEMALLGLLQALDPDKVDVDLFIYSHQGPLMDYIPKWVNLLPEKKPYSMIEKPISECIKKGEIGIAAARILAKIKHKIYLKNHTANSFLDSSIFQYIANCVTPILPNISSSHNGGNEKFYDLCISFLTPHNIGRDKVNAKKKIAWIHTDYSTISVNEKQEFPVWNAYDCIASISSDVTQSFLKTFPSFEPKIIEIENILSKDYILKKSEEFTPKLNGDIKLLSIGRFCHAKNYDNVPDIMRCILTNLSIPQSLDPSSIQIPKDLKWYIIGYGGDEDLIKSKIKEAEMEDHVILLGKKENPYPYIKACDIYIQPSRYEGKSVTVREAQMLYKPVVVTNYPTASSQIRDGIDGIIVPMDNEECARCIRDFILNKHLQESIIQNLQNLNFGNESEVNKIYKFLEL